MATITTGNAREVVSLPKATGRKKLAECLKWPPFDEDLDMRRSIHLDVLYDNLVHAAEKGFTWEKVVSVVEFANELVERFKECQSITDILTFYKSRSLDLCTSLGEREYKVYTDFLFSTTLPHFKLVKLIFTTDRKRQIPQVNLPVEPPIDAGSLKETKEVKIWDYEQKIGDLERRENERESERLQVQEDEQKQLEKQNHEVMGNVVKADTQLDKETLEGMIADVLRSLSLATADGITSSIRDLQQGLEHKLEKTSLPRPPVLGPPPRYAVTTVIQKTPTAVSLKSDKPGSRASKRK